MEKDFGSWLHQRQIDAQLPKTKSSKPPYVPLASVCANMNPTNGNLPVFQSSGVLESEAGKSKEPYGWFYCLPRFRQCLHSTPSMTVNEKPSTVASPETSVQVNISDVAGPREGSKQFLVFDQSGDKTTLIFSSRNDAPVQCLTSMSPKPTAGCIFIDDELGTTGNGRCNKGLILTDEDHGTNDMSEMHEDTEEINALLYSDEESYYDDDEVTSTGHSPCTMTAHEGHDQYEEGIEVASFSGPSKRLKLSDGSSEIAFATDTEASAKRDRSFEDENDAESSSANVGPFWRSKQTTKERIKETVSVLQNIIPGGKGKDAVFVLDEAINYLKSLKRKAESLGLSTL